MKAQNSVMLTGRLTNDPEIVSYTKEAEVKQFSKFNLAVSRGIKDDAGKDIADFIPCVAFGKTSGIAQKLLSKGDLVQLSGRLQIDRPGEGKQFTNVKIDEIIVLESKKVREERTKASEKAEEKSKVSSKKEAVLSR